MISIRKGVEPRGFTQYKGTPMASFAGLDKSLVREALLKEQGYLCAYCMCSINDSNTKIEHFESQTTYPAKQLDYSNFLAVCEGKTSNKLHCDSKKGSEEIKFNPAAFPIEQFITYTKSGELKSTNEDMIAQLQILGLNDVDLLKLNRKAVLDSVFSFIKSNNPRIKSTWQRQLTKFENKSDGKFPAYSGIVRYFLKRKLEHWH